MTHIAFVTQDVKKRSRLDEMHEGQRTKFHLRLLAGTYVTYLLPYRMVSMPQLA